MLKGRRTLHKLNIVPGNRLLIRTMCRDKNEKKIVSHVCNKTDLLLSNKCNAVDTIFSNACNTKVLIKPI